MVDFLLKDLLIEVQPVCRCTNESLKEYAQRWMV
jgi:hypothetical protein